MDSNSDKNLEELLQEKQKALRDRYSEEYLRKIKLDTVLKMGNFIADLEPDEKIEKHKKNIIDYLNVFVDANQKYNETAIRLYRNKSLSSTIYYLNDYDFYTKGTLGFVGILMGLVIDLILLLIGVAKFYYYIPIFTIVFFVRKLKKHYRLKKEDKILDI